MTYIKRHVENHIEKLVRSFKIVLVTGPRQVGKSTMLKKMFQDTYEYISLDDINELNLAKSDPKLFFINHPGKLIIDEIQYAPELFPEMKRIVDEEAQPGRFIITGSQTFTLMANVSESLAGRVGVVELKPLSTREILAVDKINPFKPSLNSIKNTGPDIETSSLWQIIHRGSMPELYQNENMDWQTFYSSYVATFIQRDVRQITSIEDLDLFTRFISVTAARASQEVNYTSMANEVGVDSKTIKSWLKILEASGIIYIIPAFSNNHLKRITKRPVLYFFDTGLLSYLNRWPTAQTLQNGAFSGAILENYCVSEIIKSYANAGYTDYPLFYYRDKDQKEIDLIIEEAGSLYPIEIKQAASVNLSMAKNMSVLDNLPDYKIGVKTILAQVERNYLLAEDVLVHMIKDI